MIAPFKELNLDNRGRWGVSCMGGKEKHKGGDSGGEQHLLS